MTLFENSYAFEYRSVKEPFLAFKKEKRTDNEGPTWHIVALSERVFFRPGPHNQNPRSNAATSGQQVFHEDELFVGGLLNFYGEYKKLGGGMVEPQFKGGEHPRFRLNGERRGRHLFICRLA